EGAHDPTSHGVDDDAAVGPRRAHDLLDRALVEAVRLERALVAGGRVVLRALRAGAEVAVLEADLHDAVGRAARDVVAVRRVLGEAKLDLAVGGLRADAAAGRGAQRRVDLPVGRLQRDLRHVGVDGDGAVGGLRREAVGLALDVDGAVGRLRGHHHDDVRGERRVDAGLRVAAAVVGLARLGLDEVRRAIGVAPGVDDALQVRVGLLLRGAVGLQHRDEAPRARAALLDVDVAVDRLEVDVHLGDAAEGARDGDGARGAEGVVPAVPRAGGVRALLARRHVAPRVVRVGGRRVLDGGVRGLDAAGREG